MASFKLAIDMLDSMGFRDKYVIACFDGTVTTYAHEKHGVKTQGFPLHLVKNLMGDTESHYYASCIGVAEITEEMCADYVKKGIDPWCWCPDTEEEVARAVGCGATLLTCNNPIAALKYLKRRE